MAKRLSVLFALCVIVLSPKSVLAQFFEKQQVAVWEMHDSNNDVKVSSATKHQIRLSIIDAFVNSQNYTTHEINVDDVKNRISEKKLAVSEKKDIASVVREMYGVDYVLFTNITILHHSDSYNNYKVHILTELISTETCKGERSAYVDMPSDQDVIHDYCAILLKDLLNEQSDEHNLVPQNKKQPSPQEVVRTVPRQQTMQEQPHQQPVSQHISTPSSGKKIGDIIDHNGSLGIVLVLYDEFGTHGLLLSVDESKLNWDDAKRWCENLGSGWRLPKTSELQLLYNKCSIITSALKAKGFNNIDFFYWSIEEYNQTDAKHVGVRNGYVGHFVKSHLNGVRAVASF